MVSRFPELIDKLLFIVNRIHDWLYLVQNILEPRANTSGDQQPMAKDFIHHLLVPIFGQDNGFLLVIDGVRKEKERLTAAKLLLLPNSL